jgi:hypothetical protein
MLFAIWRRSIAVRGEMREAFLSFMPESTICGRDLGELAMMEGVLQEITQRAATDRHLMAVVKRDGHLIRRERKKLLRAVEEES